MSYEINPDRRRFFGAAALALAGTQLDVLTRAEAQTGAAPQNPPTRKPAMSTLASFAAIKQINAGVLNVGYVEAGPADGLRRAAAWLAL
jgi:hypothetical protein